MTNANKVKGDSFERSIRDYLTGLGFVAERTRAGYARDAGDLHIGRRGTRPRAILQAKNVRAWTLGVWLIGLAQQRKEAGALHGALVIKRRGIANPGEQYIVMTVDEWAHLAHRAELHREGCEGECTGLSHRENCPEWTPPYP